MTIGNGASTELATAIFVVAGLSLAATGVGLASKFGAGLAGGGTGTAGPVSRRAAAGEGEGREADSRESGTAGWALALGLSASVLGVLFSAALTGRVAAGG